MQSILILFLVANNLIEAQLTFSQPKIHYVRVSAETARRDAARRRT